jgi:outer membrane protein assembly factor BamB
MKNLILATCFLSLIACNPAKKQNPDLGNTAQQPSYKLELVWATDTLLRTPESVLYDKQRDIFYVSDINGGSWDKDGNGFISKMDKSGKVTELKWIEGLNAPKGMGILGNSLFIADVDQVVEADIESGKIINRVEISGDPQLNDITVGDDGIVYISGSNSQKIYALKDGKVEEYFSGQEGERFNGLLWEKDRMLLLTSTSSQFKQINRETKEVKIISENMGHGDAIAPVGDGGYITTSWKGAVFYVSAEGKVDTLLDTEALGENAADACFSIENQMLYLPTFSKNQVKAYKLLKSTK